MESGERRSQRDYTLAFKLSVVDQVEKGEMTYKQAQSRNAPAGKRPFGLGLGVASAALHRLQMRGRDTLLRSSRLRERPPATIPAPIASRTVLWSPPLAAHCALHPSAPSPNAGYETY